MSNLFDTDEIDVDAAASAFPDISLDGEGDFPVPSAPPAGGAPAASNDFDFDSFDSAPSQPPVKVTGDDELEKFESEFPDIQPTPPVVQQPSFSQPTFAPRPQQSAYSSTPILTQQIEAEEPEVIKEWRKKQQEEIEAREEAAKAKRQETISKAERSIDEFYEDYAKKKERNIRENKDHEAEFLENLTSGLSSGTTWERICELVELQNSQSKSIARAGPGTTDLTRFKEVLLRLKREGASAPGAGGY